MLEEERHQEILRLLSQDYFISAKTLERVLHSSITTIRRDLDQLSARVS